MNKRFNNHLIRFRKLGIISIIAVYLLVFIGGLVRSTGSGMGCPDWPKCFGQWVPPTSAESLPTDYKEVYADKRLKKNLKLASTLSNLGLESSAALVVGDDGTYQENDFNATKTWIEYLNRLVGVLIGLILFALLLSSIPLIKFQNQLAVYSAFIVILTGFQGWLGSVVVSTNLLPGMISIHMIVALLIIAALIFAVVRTYKIEDMAPSYEFQKLRWPILILIIMAFTQVILGTNVRESIDTIAHQYGYLERSTWIESLGDVFYLHRSFSWLFVFLTGLIGYKVLSNQNMQKMEKWFAYGLIFVVVAEILVGVGMAYFGIPAFLQPIHLLLGSLLFGLAAFGSFWAFSNFESQNTNAVI